MFWLQHRILSIWDAILTDVFISHATCHVPSPGGGGRESEVSGNIKSWDEARPRLEEDYFALIWDEWGEPISISLCLLLHITNLTDYWQTPVWLALLLFILLHVSTDFIDPSTMSFQTRFVSCLKVTNASRYWGQDLDLPLTPHTLQPLQTSTLRNFTRGLRLRRGSCDWACAEAFVGSFLTSWLLEYPGCCHFNCC